MPLVRDRYALAWAAAALLLLGAGCGPLSRSPSSNGGAGGGYVPNTTANSGGYTGLGFAGFGFGGFAGFGFAGFGGAYAGAPGLGGPCTPQSQVCDPVCNTGCTQPGTRCGLSQASARTGECIQSGTGAIGMSCQRGQLADTCAPGNVCLEDSRCYRMCYSDEHCGPNACCTVALFQTGSVPLGISVCSFAANCDPTMLTDGGCGAGNGCYFTPCRANGNSTTCFRAGVGQTGQPCVNAGDCAPGNLCGAGIGTQNYSCLRVCHMGTTSTCATGQTCVALTGPTAGVSSMFGVCR
jgi:hypothetical protein